MTTCDSDKHSTKRHVNCLDLKADSESSLTGVGLPPPPSYHQASYLPSLRSHHTPGQTMSIDVPPPTDQPPIKPTPPTAVSQPLQVNGPLSRIPFSQRRVPPAKLNMTLDLSVTSTPRKVVHVREVTSESEGSNSHVGSAAVGIAATSGVVSIYTFTIFRTCSISPQYIVCQNYPVL